MEPSLAPVLCITGPTAAGKSDLGVQIAKAVGGEVISADSMQVYRKMDIGTAKLTPEEMQGVPHHLMDVAEPDEPFTVADWTRLAHDCIERLHQSGKLPIIVGGTGLYIKSIVDGLDFSGQAGSPEIREKWHQYALTNGPDALYLALVERDSQTAQRLHKNDQRRIVRALELYETTHRPMSQTYDWQESRGRYDATQIAIDMERAALYQRVELRVDVMLQRGLYREVSELLEAGYSRSLTSMQAIGYKELAACIDGETSYEEAVAQMKQATRRFVKRQLSWFRRDKRIMWLNREPDGQFPPGAVKSILDTASRLAAGIHVQRHE